ncbi:hypothetical protein DPSP01_008544 [Paraphaeosphaeria sporulosa]
MIDQEKFANSPSLYDRLTWEERLIGHGDHAGALLRTKQTTRLIEPIPPDDSSLMSRAPLLPLHNESRPQGDSSVTHIHASPKHISGWSVTELVSQTIRIHNVAALHANVSHLSSRAAVDVELHSYHPALPLPSGETHLCAAATAVHWSISLLESLRTVCTTVIPPTKTPVALRVVHTTADFHNLTIFGISTIERASATTVPANPGPNLPPITTPPDDDLLDHPQSLCGTPPLPPISTPPDEDALVLGDNLASKSSLSRSSQA